MSSYLSMSLLPSLRMKNLFKTWYSVVPLRITLIKEVTLFLLSFSSLETPLVLRKMMSARWKGKSKDNKSTLQQNPLRGFFIDETHWKKWIFHWWRLWYYTQVCWRHCLVRRILSLATPVEIRNNITITMVHFGKYDENIQGSEDIFFNLGTLKVLSHCINNAGDGGEDGKAERKMYENIQFLLRDKLNRVNIIIISS